MTAGGGVGTLVGQLPALVRVLAVFVFILAAIRKRVSLGSAFLAGSVLLGLLFGYGPREITASVLGSISQPKTVALAAVVSLILLLSHSMERAGQLRRMLGSFRGLVRSPRLGIIVFPSLIGLLPMPGGAIFSAPMVRALGEPRFSAAQLSYINFWFRHVWEYWWPLYPGVLLATALARVDLWRFVLIMLPLTPVALWAGYVPLRAASAPPEEAPAGEGRAGSSLGRFAAELSPILLVIVGGIGTGTLLSAVLERGGTLHGIAKETGLIVALVASVGLVWRQNRLAPGERRRILLNPELLKMIYMVASVFVFKGILEDSGAVGIISRELLSWGIPLVLVTVALPFLVGGVVGLTVAFVGASFPILFALVQSAGEQPHLLAYVMLAMVSGFAGVLLSPLHLCLILSNGFFSAEPAKVYRLLLFPCLAVLGAGLVLFWLLRMLAG